MSIADEVGWVGVDMAAAFPIATSWKVFAAAGRLIRRADEAEREGNGLFASQLVGEANEKLAKSQRIRRSAVPA